MKYKHILTFLAVFSLFLIQGCSITVNRGEEEKTQEDTRPDTEINEVANDNDVKVDVEVNEQMGKIRDLPTFNSLLHNIAGNIVWKQGSEQRLEIQSTDEVLSQVVTEVKEGGLLYIGFRDRDFQLNDNKLYIFITTPDIKAIRLSGSGNLEAKNRWKVGDLSLAISGSGNMNISLKADKVLADISGSGNINLKGKADEYVIEMSGAGQIAGDKLKVDNCEVNLSGSGSCVLNVTDKLDVKINGSGSVIYKGNPEISKSIDGSGSVVKK